MSSESRTTKYFDRISLVLFALMAITGAALTKIQPEVSLRLRGAGIDITRGVLGISIVSWVQMHRVIAMLALLSLTPNSFLEGGAILAALRRRPVDGSLARGLVGLVAIVAVMFAVVAPKSEGPAARMNVPVGMEATMQAKTLDRLSLSDIENHMKVPQSYMREKLKLPREVSAETPLSFYMSRYRFSFNDLQQAIFEYNNQPAREPKRR